MHVAILLHDEPDSAALRDQYRQRHLDYLRRFQDQTLFAGPFTADDESADLGSLRLMSFPDRAAAERHVAEEPYVMGGVQKRWQIHRWQPGLPHSWRDCPRTRGHVQVMFHGLDDPGRHAGREEWRAAREAYLARHAGLVMAHGPLLADDGDGAVGDVLLLDVPDLEAARAFLAREPFHGHDLYRDVSFHRWRFGRVMDRFR